MPCCRKKKPANAYPGADQDIALNDKTTPAEVKEETSRLNNNPRDDQ